MKRFMKNDIFQKVLMAKNFHNSHESETLQSDWCTTRHLEWIETSPKLSSNYVLSLEHLRIHL